MADVEQRLGSCASSFHQPLTLPPKSEVDQPHADHAQICWVSFLAYAFEDGIAGGNEAKTYHVAVPYFQTRPTTYIGVMSKPVRHAKMLVEFAMKVLG